MAKTHSRYVCQACGDAFLRWEGQCRTCGAWNTLVETVVREPARSARAAGPVAAGLLGRPTPQPLGEVVEPEVPRLSVGIGELDRVLGGGLVPGSLVLVGGEPGIGKSTLLLQAASGVAGRLASAGGHVLYATGEESAGQVRLRAARLGLLDGSAGIGVRVVAESEIGRVIELAREDRPGASARSARPPSG